MNRKQRALLRDYGMIILGTLFLAVSTKNIFDPAGLVTGGFSGLGIILKGLFGVPLWIITVVLNVPLFIAGYFLKGKDFTGRTLFSSVLLTVMLAVLPDRALIDVNDLFLTSVFGIEKALYAIIAVYIFTKVFNAILEGMHFAKAVCIISGKSREIAERIMHDLDRGVTGISSVGMYTGNPAVMTYCVVSNKEIVAVRDIVEEIDPKAFMIVSDVREVMGEGFSREKKQILSTD